MSTCQQHQHGHGRHDPTMDSCCERDLAEQAQARVHLKRLQAVDPSTARSGMAAAVLGTPTVSVSSHEEWDSMEAATERTQVKLVSRGKYRFSHAVLLR